jgi:chemotaxis family two-component system response regulator Rcp1
MTVEIGPSIRASESRSGPPKGPSSAPQLEVKAALRKKIALLAEDNPADALLIEEAIERHNVPVELHVVDDGEKAIAFIERAESDPDAPCPEVLLLDLNLPRRSGKEVLERIRRSEKCKNIPVLVISSSDLSRDREELAQLGARGYFRKPTSYEQFLKVGEVLKALLEDELVN